MSMLTLTLVLGANRPLLFVVRGDGPPTRELREVLLYFIDVVFSGSLRNLFMHQVQFGNYKLHTF